MPHHWICSQVCPLFHCVVKGMLRLKTEKMYITGFLYGEVRWIKEFKKIRKHCMIGLLLSEGTKVMALPHRILLNEKSFTCDFLIQKLHLSIKCHGKPVTKVEWVCHTKASNKWNISHYTSSYLTHAIASCIIVTQWWETGGFTRG